MSDVDWKARYMDLSQELVDRKNQMIDLEHKVMRLEADKRRLDWLADPANNIGQVMLPREIVERNIHSLRDAIDEAMELKEIKQ